MAETKTRAATVVRYGMNREIPINDEMAEALRQSGMEQVDQLIDKAVTSWADLDHKALQGQTPNQEQRAVIGGVFWALGEARDRLNDLLYLTEGATEGQSSPISQSGGQQQRQTDPKSHEFAGEAGSSR